MDDSFLHELSEAAEAHGVYAEDSADRLNSKYTSMGLLALAAITVMRQYVFKPIDCFVPANWPRPWEEFAETYCWTQGTYRVSLTDAAHPAVQKRGELTINYYQWVPILLVVQAILVMAPHQLWCMGSRYLSGRDPHVIVRFAREAERAGHPKTKKRLQVYVARQIELGAAAPATARGCSEALRQSGCALFIIYMISKVVYLSSAVGQILLLQSYLGFSSPLFGWHCARSLLFNGGQWQQTGVFPRIKFCDVPLHQVGQLNLHSIQCVLAVNMIYEKLFIFLWFWFAFCLLVTVLYAICWVAELLTESSRNRVIKYHLRRLLQAKPQAVHSDQTELPHPREELATQGRQLRLDDVFLLQMIADNLNSLCAAQVLRRLLELQVGNQPLFGPVSKV